MGWSLSQLSLREPASVNVALLAAGRALYLANAFESKCRFVLRIAQLESHIAAHPTATLSDAIAAISRDKLLAPTIASLRLFPQVTPSEVCLLEKARDARNFIAHEGAGFGYIFSVREEQVRNHLWKLRAAIAELSQGDNVVSRWVYEIEEKKPVPIGMGSTYHIVVDAWVFEDVRENLMQQLSERRFEHKGKNFALKLFGTNSGFSVAAFLAGQQVSPSYSVDFIAHTDHFMQYKESLTENLFRIAQSDIEQGMYFRGA